MEMCGTVEALEQEEEWKCRIKIEACADQRRDMWYSCDQCDYKTTWKGSLKRHIDAIHGDVRYTCNQCDYKATQKGNLKRHIDSVHGDVIYTCDQCHYKGNTEAKSQKTYRLCSWRC